MQAIQKLDGNITAGATPDATATVKGKIQLAGDLTGTAAAPTVADNAITSAKIADGTIVNADISTSAAIAGTKISPDFGTQNVVTTGTLGSGNITSSGTITGTNLYATGGSLITTNTAGYLMNSGATSLRIGGESTDTKIGATTGTTTIKNDAVIEGRRPNFRGRLYISCWDYRI